MPTPRKNRPSKSAAAVAAAWATIVGWILISGHVTPVPTRISLDSERPRDAVTHFDVERLLDRHALLRVRLETGRMHQIRVHLAAIGLPVVGDRVYGVPEPLLERQFLHAASLACPHPATGARVEAESPLPADLQGFLDRLD